MRYAAPGAPFDERGGRLRGVLDLAAGRYPAFLFGRDVGRVLRVFHFHESTAEALEPVFQYLVENGYRTVTSDAAARLARDGTHPGDRTVMLAFDDCWSSLWLVVAPLLEKYDLRAVAYAIPARVVDADRPRPAAGVTTAAARAADEARDPLVTWPELRAMSSSGRVDVQSHTWSHSMIFTGEKVLGSVDAAFAQESRLNHPRLNTGDPPEFLDGDREGFPLFARRSRMSDARRFVPDLESCARAEALAAGAKGSGGLVARVDGRWETETEQDAAIEHELARGRDELQARLATSVRHVCLPWGVSGDRTRRLLDRLGFASAFANRWTGRFAVAAGDDPFYLKRLHSKHIFALPGRGRRSFTMFA